MLIFFHLFDPPWTSGNFNIVLVKDQKSTLFYSLLLKVVHKNVTHGHSDKIAPGTVRVTEIIPEHVNQLTECVIVPLDLTESTVKINVLWGIQRIRV